MHGYSAAIDTIYYNGMGLDTGQHCSIYTGTFRTYAFLPYLEYDRPGATESRIQHFHSKKLNITIISTIARQLPVVEGIMATPRWSAAAASALATSYLVGVGAFFREKSSRNPFPLSVLLSVVLFPAFGFRTPKSGKRAGAYFPKMRLRAPCVRTFLLVVNLHL